MLGSLILCLNGMRITMFQLSGFYYRGTLPQVDRLELKRFLGVMRYNSEVVSDNVLGFYV